MSQQRRAEDMGRMLKVLDSGFKLVGRAFRTFEYLNKELAEQYTLKDGAFTAQSPPPPVHMLYEGFEKFGKELTIFEETMGKIADDDWEVPAKRRKTRHGDDVEDEDCPRVPDPGPPFILIEQGFSTLHRTFDIFESHVHDQSHSEGEVVVAPAKPAHAQAKILGMEKHSEKVEVEDQEPARQSHPEEKVADVTAKALSAQGNKIRGVKILPDGETSTSHSKAKEYKTTRQEGGKVETSAPAPLTDTQESQEMLMPESLKKHAAGGQDSGQDDMLPPAKRRAVFDQEPHSRRAAPVFAHREQGSHRRPVGELGSQRPWRENSGYYRSSDSRRVAESAMEQDRRFSVASRDTFSAPRGDFSPRRRLPPWPPAEYTEFSSPSRSRYTTGFPTDNARPARSQESRPGNPYHARGQTDVWISDGRPLWR